MPPSVRPRTTVCMRPLTKVAVSNARGTGGRQRSPRSARRKRRAILEEVPLSSMKTRRSGARSGWPSNQVCRWRATSAGSCPAAAGSHGCVEPLGDLGQHQVQLGANPAHDEIGVPVDATRTTSTPPPRLALSPRPRLGQPSGWRRGRRRRTASPPDPETRLLPLPQQPSDEDRGKERWPRELGSSASPLGESVMTRHGKYSSTITTPAPAKAYQWQRIYV